MTIITRHVLGILHWRLLERIRKLTIVICLLAFAALSLPAGVQAAIFPGTDMAVEQKKQNAIALLQNSRLEEAYAAFMQLLREIPDDDAVNLGITAAAMGSKRYTQALLACERLLAKYPQDSALRVQLAKIYLALNEPESARLELARAFPTSLLPMRSRRCRPADPAGSTWAGSAPASFTTATPTRGQIPIC
jgi:tetratricopeptide (TPR) repeat protein